ncbi:sensor histidine kinase [Actinocrinis sp.]|uniref:sensor histidine kinase n=1 Tax=Actinocrinis sp. TaxID=1920516 RepID=UPI002D37CAC2|nr:sensor histidine kinase [Actinocrinis sp.]HZP51889.1 sensor histidine kinase [Actinocrinis sp.]
MTAATGVRSGAAAAGSAGGAGPSRHAPLLRGPFSRLVWRDAAFVAAGSSWAVVFVLALIVDSKLWWSVSTLAVALGAILLPHLLRFATIMQRSRFGALLGVELRTEGAPDAQPASWRAFLVTLRTGDAWRQLGYHFVAAPAFAAAGLGMILLGGAGFVLLLLPAIAPALPPHSPLRTPGAASRDVLLCAAGVAALWLSAWLAGIIAALDERAAMALLGPDRAVQLEQRVAGLTESRSALVHAVDAERRRIERDLHDGVQQRLVSLAINLGMARSQLDGLPPEAGAVIGAAHEEAKAAMAELRDLVRGLHPAVLDDRGLDAALSGIAARAPFPVRLSVEVPERAAPAVEAVAYFVVSEALTNIAKHAEAAQADVEVVQTRGRLRLRIVDDGVGGADPARGSGLAGLARRAASVDGTFALTSPVGGPTVITVELPCVL